MSVWIVKDGHGNPYLNARGEWSERQSEAVRFVSRERAWAGIEEGLANRHTLEAPRILRLAPSKNARDVVRLRAAIESMLACAARSPPCNQCRTVGEVALRSTEAKP